MKKTIKTICLLLIFALVTPLSACHSNPEQSEIPVDTNVTPNVPTVTIPEPIVSGETTSGYISTEIDTPDWIKSLGCCEIIGDVFYMAAYPKEGGIAAASYDTVKDEWQRYDLDTGSALYPSIDRLSATEDSLWVLLREGFSDEELEKSNYSRTLDYYLVHMNLNTGEQSCRHVDFWQEGKPYLMSLIALDSDRALVGDDNKTRLISPDAQVIGTPNLQLMGMGFHNHIGGELYVNTAAGLSRLDKEALSYDAPVAGIGEQTLYSSTLGHFPIMEENQFLFVDPVTGERTKLFDWIDVALSYRHMYGLDGLENSLGDIYHLTDRLIKVTPGQVPLKKTLTLACFGDASAAMYELSDTSYVCPDSIMDAVVRFNNTDPEYKIELKPLIYHDETERNRLLMELATGSDIDIVDTSLLPEGAIDKELLIDLMPYIDADASIGREDFIPSLLTAMTRNGGLYEYTDKVAMFTMLTCPELAGEDWTVENILELSFTHPEKKLPVNRDRLLIHFIRAATAEFMDWTDMSCNFDCPEFTAWLTLLKTLADRPVDMSEAPPLFETTFDFSGDSWLHTIMQGDYVPVGFPDAEGTGSYFIKLGRPNVFGSGYFPDGRGNGGCNTSLGILASGKNRDGAWRFMRTFMQGEAEPVLATGIPVLKDRFEWAVDAWVEREKAQDHRGSQYAFFNDSDAQALRELVYNSDKFVCEDEPVINTLETVINAYLGGKGSAEEAAQQIQSRLSLYMAELA